MLDEHFCRAARRVDTMSDDHEMEDSEPKTASAPALVTSALAPWVEKYRPATIDDLQQQDQVCSPLSVVFASTPWAAPCAHSTPATPLRAGHGAPANAHVRGARWCRR